MQRDWHTTHRRIYLGLIDGDVRRRPARREHPKTEHRDSDSEERQPHSTRSGNPTLRFRAVGHYRTDSSRSVYGRSGVSHVSHLGLAKVITFRNKLRTTHRCAMSLELSCYAQGSGERDVRLFLKRWGAYPKWWCDGKSKKAGVNRYEQREPGPFLTLQIRYLVQMILLQWAFPASSPITTRSMTQSRVYPSTLERFPLYNEP